jgi:hypothetical protein
MTRPASDGRWQMSNVFGTESPLESSDERNLDVDDRERWLRENVPPHHI